MRAHARQLYNHKFSFIKVENKRQIYSCILIFLILLVVQNMSIDELMNGLKQGFIDQRIIAQEQFIPQLITNNPSKNEKVITTIKNEMCSCDEFMFNVAFITWSGINALLNEFKELEKYNIHGKIIASQYQNFTEPKALFKLISFKNIDVRIVTEDSMKMHSKCYIFKKSGYYGVIIGSSNLTDNALCENCEWNLKINSLESGKIIDDVINEFNRVFEYATVVNKPGSVNTASSMMIQKG